MSKINFNKKLSKKRVQKSMGYFDPPPKKSPGWKSTNPRGQNCRGARCEGTTSELESIRRPPDFRWILYGESIFRSPTPTAKSGGPTPSKSRTKRVREGRSRRHQKVHARTLCEKFFRGGPKKGKRPPPPKSRNFSRTKILEWVPLDREIEVRKKKKKTRVGEKVTMLKK